MATRIVYSIKIGSIGAAYAQQGQDSILVLCPTLSAKQQQQHVDRLTDGDVEWHAQSYTSGSPPPGMTA